jgi:hypothetical protein
MTSQSLNYALSKKPRSYRRFAWRVLAIALALLFGMLALTVTVRQDEGRIDAVTGTMTKKSVWPFDITTAPQTNVSPLEARLKSIGMTWTPSWRLIYNTHHNVFGGVTCRACGSAPPIYQLQPVLKDFVAASTDQELREFVRVMQSGTEAERNAAVEAAAEKGVEWLATAGQVQ